MTALLATMFALEKLGLLLWRRVQPFAARLLPPRSLLQAYSAGVVWGLLGYGTCGLLHLNLHA